MSSEEKVPKTRHASLGGHVAHYGESETVVVDQGGEFESTFAFECEEMEIDFRVTGSPAELQQGWVERHGWLPE